MEAPALNGGINGKEGNAVKLAEPEAKVPEAPPQSTAGLPFSATNNRPEENGFYGAPIPANEKERHETLCACQILDSAPDPRFDDITKLVRTLTSRLACHVFMSSCGADLHHHPLRSCMHRAPRCDISTPGSLAAKGLPLCSVESWSLSLMRAYMAPCLSLVN